MTKAVAPVAATGFDEKDVLPSQVIEVESVELRSVTVPVTVDGPRRRFVEATVRFNDAPLDGRATRVFDLLRYLRETDARAHSYDLTYPDRRARLTFLLPPIHVPKLFEVLKV